MRHLTVYLLALMILIGPISPLAVSSPSVSLRDEWNPGNRSHVLGSDTGTQSPTAVPIAAGPTTAGGTVTLNANGSFACDPPTAIFTGADSFTYMATNGQLPNDTATVSITVNPSNTPPVANDDTGSASEAGGVTNGTAGTTRRLPPAAKNGHLGPIVKTTCLPGQMQL